MQGDVIIGDGFQNFKSCQTLQSQLGRSRCHILLLQKSQMTRREIQVRRLTFVKTVTSATHRAERFGLTEADNDM